MGSLQDGAVAQSSLLSQASKLLSSLVAQGAVLGGEVAIPCLDVLMQGYSQLLIDNLLAVGAVSIRYDPDLGEPQLQVDFARVVWKHGLALDRGRNALVACAESAAAAGKKCGSKLALVLRLASLDWKPAPPPLADHKFGDRQFDHSFRSRPASYYLALLDEDGIQRRGSDVIVEGQRDAYYLCLLGLPTSLDLLHAHPDFPTWNNRDFQRILKLGPDCLRGPLPALVGPDPMLALEDAPDPDPLDGHGDSDGDGDGPSPDGGDPPPPPPPYEMLCKPIAEVGDDMKRAFQLRTPDHIVKFDNCTHASGAFFLYAFFFTRRIVQGAGVREGI